MLLHYAEDLHHGKGFVNIRGLDPNHYSSEDNILLFLGISSYIGEKRAKQDDDGSMLSMSLIFLVCFPLFMTFLSAYIRRKTFPRIATKSAHEVFNPSFSIATPLLILLQKLI